MAPSPWLFNLTRTLLKSRRTPTSPTLTALPRLFSSTSPPLPPSPPEAGLGPTGAGEKPRVVVLGSGWAGCRLMKGIDTSVYDVVCVSPRNHMVFTPLLASTCVGTLEFRSVAEPIARIQPSISRAPGSYFFLARCKAVDIDDHTETSSPEPNFQSVEFVNSEANPMIPFQILDILRMDRKKIEIFERTGWRMVAPPLPQAKETTLPPSQFSLKNAQQAAFNPSSTPCPNEEKTYIRVGKAWLHCETVTDGSNPSNLEPWNFKVSYDKLVIASGAEASTFGIQGVKKHAIFLREVAHAQEIRRKLLLNLMLSDVPGISDAEKSRLLHCVVVGGGPTGVEFSGELSDFIIRDVQQRYSHVKDFIHVTLIEANEILSSFDVRLRQYATNHLTKSGVRLVRGIVKDVQPEKIILNDGTEVPYGLLVWSTGVGPSSFISSLQFPKSPGGRIGVDEWLRVPSAQDVFSIGDCSGFLESTGKPTLPALAQVAERQGKYLAGLLNRIGKAGGGHANSSKDMELGDPFVYKHLGSMASVGRHKALVDLRQSKEAKGLSLAGFVSWFIWRSAYLTRVVSWRNRFYVAINWATTFVFGRDISRL
ncbi:hypothetical protein QJS04_geneDACA010593 [Acorus gramineus]|uniref:NADH:ubiquinone reductase (non-electrogenic) n=1 Tax=Acorus gramineus TaxID=55184 RepID=A0AAV9AJG3_ACOGR|nr:hypothetical protein QJS04_geneDACA010593 [Acorus gramineus]